MWIVHLIVGFVFAVTTAFLAHHKGRNALGWFIVGFLVGPFGLIVAALPAVPRDGVLVRCPSCSEVISAQARACRFCGNERGIETAPDETAA